MTVLHVTMSGRHTGDFVTYGPDAKVERVFVPTGKAFEVTQTHWQRIREGQVVEHWANRDDQGDAGGLGAAVTRVSVPLRPRDVEGSPQRLTWDGLQALTHTSRRAM